MAPTQAALLFGPGLGDTQRGLLVALKRRGVATLAELARSVRVAPATVREHLQALSGRRTAIPPPGRRAAARAGAVSRAPGPGRARGRLSARARCRRARGGARAGARARWRGTARRGGADPFRVGVHGRGGARRGRRSDAAALPLPDSQLGRRDARAVPARDRVGRGARRREARARRVHARRRRRVQLPPGGGRRAVVGVAPLRLGCHRATRSGVSPPSPSAWSFTRWPAFFRAPLPRPRPHWSPHPEPLGLDRHPLARFLSSATPPTPSPLLASPPDPLSLRERGHSRPAPLGSPAATSCSCARDSGSASGSSWPEYRSDGSPPAHHGGPQGRARARVAPGADTRRAVRVVAVAEPRGAGPQVPPPACAARLHRGLLL